LAVPAAAEECLDCHELDAISPGGTVVHAPFADKDCGSCHADHGDEERLMLTEEGNALCAQCHEFKDAPFVAAHRKIAPTGKAACTGCHDPHRAPGKRLLRAELHGPVKTGNCEKCHRGDGKLLIPINMDFCFICHKRAGFAQPVVHDPVKKARCLDCHDPHGGGRARLLKGDYTLEREATPGGKDYGLCLGCHERAKLLGAAGEATTRFADGARNLHALHVLVQGRSTEKAGEKGLTCRVCHDPHSSTTAALTRTELDCGASLCMKMEFRRTDGGGECMASCHAERVRYRAAVAPAAPAPAASQP
jgi:predicted CXXCH cytochrome family protein